MALDVKYNNSAGRLLALMSTLRDATSTASQGHVLLTVYPTLFPGVSAERAAENINVNVSTLELQVEFNKLIDEVFQDAEELCKKNLDYRLFQQALAPINQLRVRLASSQNLKNATEPFTESVEMALFTFAQALSPTPDADVNEIAAIRESIDELMTKIEVSELPRSIQVFLFNMQRASRDMLDRYRITGTRGLREQFHKVLGEMADVYRQDDKKASERSGLWDQIRGFVDRMDKVVAGAMKYPVLVDKSGAAVEAIEKLLE